MGIYKQKTAFISQIKTSLGRVHGVIFRVSLTCGGGTILAAVTRFFVDRSSVSRKAIVAKMLRAAEG
jgi:hypothetical protein